MLKLGFSCRVLVLKEHRPLDLGFDIVHGNRGQLWKLALEFSSIFSSFPPISTSQFLCAPLRRLETIVTALMGMQTSSQLWNAQSHILGSGPSPAVFVCWEVTEEDFSGASETLGQMS